MAQSSEAMANPSGGSLAVMPAMLNDTLASLSGRIAANYLVQRQNQQQQQYLIFCSNLMESNMIVIKMRAHLFPSKQFEQKIRILWCSNIFRLALPDDLRLAKKSLVSTMSELYAMTLIVFCLAFTSTEIITDQVALDYFESWGFYTYLYRWIRAYMHQPSRYSTFQSGPENVPKKPSLLNIGHGEKFLAKRLIQKYIFMSPWEISRIFTLLWSSVCIA